jgi:hypothetical protein
VCDIGQQRKLVLPEAPPLQQPAVCGSFEHVHIAACGPFNTHVLDVHGRIFMPEKPLKAHVAAYRELDTCVRRLWA